MTSASASSGTSLSCLRLELELSWVVDLGLLEALREAGGVEVDAWDCGMR